MYAPSFASLGALHLPVVSGLRRSSHCGVARGDRELLDPD
jgi:hypothetical protein